MAAVEAYLNGQASAHPELAEHFSEMLDLYERRLWHQLTLKLEECIAMPAFQTGELLIQLYHSFVTDFEHKISPLKLGHIAVAVGGRYGDRAAAAAFMDTVVVKLTEGRQPGHEEPVLYLRMHIALLHVNDGRASEARAMVLEDGKAALDALAAPDPSVSAAFYWVCSQYHKEKQNFAEFYRTGMMYLAYISSDDLPEEARRDLAVNLSLAALLGEDLYNFAELIAHPVTAALDGTAFAWLQEIVAAFNDGDLHRYDVLCVTHADALNAQPAMVSSERTLREKITILCLLQIVFQMPAENRVIALADIAARTKLSVDGVEYLLMKALSVHLIEGIVDQVSATVNVTWVQPRVLLKPQIQDLSLRLDGWIAKVKGVGDALREEIPQLAGTMV
mmetsp:Transcript_20276/g.32862  ORF Transcript_20276/g.32862 Transcript_20276/m.32862 type:complete len:391 (-) Transcript_20276:1318-2490(-)|eukprot:CAMPEP_0198686532 /NCGR_PEP_ID=MMETSP1468-20131203/15031_1 /TAXON_ID=1461545 /ORGANISM="Mantoniella sp, Strain CCMP1436" /LENGTH=390 /DNA_ID=CAMNT_0044432701 /DNA_START=115 /DNA_END=1287 /DNA_ORIENTATION=+